MGRPSLALSLSVLLCVATSPAQAGKVLKLADVAAFEESVLEDEGVWLTAFIHQDDQTPNLLAELAAALDGAVAVAVAEFKNVKEVAYENNVRKRNCPQLRLFNVRSRNSVKVELGEKPSAQALAAAVRALLGENSVDESSGRIKKITLALGGGGAGGEL